MASSTRNQARIEQAKRGLEQLERDYAAWHQRRSAADRHQQYATQLEALKTVVERGAGEIAGQLPGIHPDRPAGEVYDACRGIELRTVWLRRVWDFFREKFDQRDRPAAGSLLRAADEVVWSCFRQVFQIAGEEIPDVVQTPPPLPFIESRYGPEAFPPELVPQDLKRDVDLTFLESYLKRLPIPLVRIPPWAVDAPWWLVFLAHEIGHHVQSQLLPDRALVLEFRKQVGAAAAQAAGDEAGERWSDWSLELFADLYSVLMMGPWAAHALFEAELRQPQAMVIRRAGYPPAAVRLELMIAWAKTLGLADEAPAGFDFRRIAAAGADAQADLDLVPTIVACARNFEVCGVPLFDRCGFQSAFYQSGGQTGEWADALAADVAPSPWNVVEGARLAASAGFAAFDEVNGAADRKRVGQRLPRLAERARELIEKSREEGKRDSSARVDTDALGKELTRALIAIDTRDLAAAELR